VDRGGQLEALQVESLWVVGAGAARGLHDGHADSIMDGKKMPPVVGYTSCVTELRNG
jgi:hypothetical protein